MHWFQCASSWKTPVTLTAILFVRFGLIMLNFEVRRVILYDFFFFFRWIFRMWKIEYKFTDISRSFIWYLTWNVWYFIVTVLFFQKAMIFMINKNISWFCIHLLSFYLKIFFVTVYWLTSFTKDISLIYNFKKSLAIFKYFNTYIK